MFCQPGQAGVSVKLAAVETAFEGWCIVYIHCYQVSRFKGGNSQRRFVWLLADALCNEFTKVSKEQA